MPIEPKTKLEFPTLEKETISNKSIANRVDNVFFREKYVNLPLITVKEFNNPIFVKSLLLEEDNAREAPIVEVEMEHLSDFLKTDMEIIAKRDIKISSQINDEQWDEQLNKNCLTALARFFSYLRYTEPFLRTREDVALKERCAGFVDFCKKKIDLFEEFFPLPKRCRLFAERLLEIIHKDKNTSVDDKDIFILKYESFMAVLEKFYYLQCDDVFKKPNIFLSMSRKNNLLFDFVGKKPSSEQTEIYKSFEKELTKLLKDTKNQNIVEDTQNIKNKIKAVIESTFNKNSISGKESFLDAMKREVFTSECVELTKSEMRGVRNIWSEIKKHITNNSASMKISRICVNGEDIPEQDMLVAAEFLRSIVKKENGLVLGEWDPARLPSDSEIRQDLVVVAMTNLAFPKFLINDFLVIALNNLGSLGRAFSQLTKEERMGVMCAEVRCGEKSFPLLPLLFLDSDNMYDLVDVIKDFVPRVFDIRFQINKETKECNIIELLEMINDCLKKMTDGDIEWGIGKKERTYFLRSLDKSISKLKEAKKDLDSQKSKIQELQMLEKEPRTLMHQAMKEGEESLNTPPLFL